MNEPSIERSGSFSVVGVGIAACAACCAGPILALLGGLSLAGAVGSLLIGIAGLAVALVAGIAFFVMHGRRRRRSCSTERPAPVPVASPTRRP
jgi:hypothetical protein